MCVLKSTKDTLHSSEIRTARAPRYLNYKYFCAGFSIGESDLIPIIFKVGSAHNNSNTAWIMPRMPPIIRPDEADGMLLFSDSSLHYSSWHVTNILVQSSDSSVEINVFPSVLFILM